MDRLTRRDEYGNADIIGVESEDLQLHLTYDEMNKVTNALNKLAHYEDLEEQGRLVEGKPVDFAYLADWYISSVMDDEEPVWTDAHINELLYDFILIPKPEEEAEAKLAEEGGATND